MTEETVVGEMVEGYGDPFRPTRKIKFYKNSVKVIDCKNEKENESPYMDYDSYIENHQMMIDFAIKAKLKGATT